MGEILRPSLPPVLWFAVAAWCGVCAGAIVALKSVDVAVAAAVAAVGSAVVICWRASRGRASGAVVVCLGLAIGVLCGVLWGLGVCREATRLESAGFRDWSGVVVADPRAVGDGTVVRIALDGRLGPSCAEVWWPEGVPVPVMGQRAAFSALLRQEEDGAERFRRRLNGVCASGTAVSALGLRWPDSLGNPVMRLRESLRQRLSQVQGDGGVLLGALLIGHRERLRGSLLEADFRATGTAHLLAVSGTHVAVVGGFVGAIARVLRVRRPWAVVCIATFAILQCGLCGGQPSALRACGMTIVVGLAGLSGRRTDSLASLGACVAAIVLMWPEQAFSLGLRLSFCAVAGILLFGRLAETWLRALLPRVLRGVCGALSVALVAQASTLPASVPVWQTVSNVSPAANLVAVPMSACALVCGVVGAAASTLSSRVAEACWGVSAALLEIMAQVLKYLASVPWATTLVHASAFAAGSVAASIGAAVWVLWPNQPRGGGFRWLVAGLTAACVVVPGTGVYSRGAEVIFLDVGQGDAVLVRDGGQSLLVDSGPDASALREALARASVRNLDALLLTHDHADHTAGLSGLRGSVRVPRLLVGSGQESAGCTAGLPGCEIAAVSAGDVMRVGGLEVEVLWPKDGGSKVDRLDENSRSVVLVVRRGETEVLLSGDAEEPVWETLDSDGLLPECEVLKVPHHGSAGGIDRDNLETVNPSVAIVSVGADNEFGHPSPSMMAELESVCARVVRTDTQGDVRVLLADDRVTVDCQQRGGRYSAYETIHAVRGTNTHATISRRRRQPPWLRRNLPISSRSISSMGPKRTCSKRPSIDSLPASPRSPTWTTTSRFSMGRRPRRMTC